MLKPYLTLHQSDTPMAPFIYEDLKRLIFKLLKLVVKPSVIETLTNQSSIVSFDCTRGQNFMQPSNFNLGCATERSISRLKKLGVAEDIEIYNFSMECKEFVCGIVKKIVECSPVEKPVAKYLSLFDPTNLAEKSKGYLEKLMKRLLHEYLASRKIITAKIADEALLEFRDFMNKVQKQKILKMCKDCVRLDERLDDFYFKKLNVDVFPTLSKICQLVFCISHGQASVERGFSINKNIAQHNMEEDTFVSRRLIKDHLLTKIVFYQQSLKLRLSFHWLC